MKHYKWNIRIFIRNLLIFLAVAFLIWFGISYLEIVAKNINGNPQYSFLNLFILLTKF